MSSEKSPKSGNWAERGLGFLRNIHIVIGAVALGFGVVPIAVYEFINAGVHEVGRQIVKGRGGKSPSKMGGVALAGT